MNRTQRVEDIMRLEAIAAAATRRAAAQRGELENEAREELASQGTAPTWRLPDIGTIALPLSKTTAVVSDIDALKAWVAKQHPDEIQTVTEIRAAYQTALLQRVVCDGDVVRDPDTSAVIPGMAVRAGGIPQSLRFTPDRDAKAVMAVLGDHLLDRLLATVQPVEVLAEAVPGGH